MGCPARQLGRAVGPPDVCKVVARPSAPVGGSSAARLPWAANPTTDADQQGPEAGADDCQAAVVRTGAVRQALLDEPVVDFTLLISRHRVSNFTRASAFMIVIVSSYAFCIRSVRPAPLRCPLVPHW